MYVVEFRITQSILTLGLSRGVVRGDGPKAGTSGASEAARAKQTPWPN